MVWTDTILVCVSRIERLCGQSRAFTWDTSRTGSQPDARGGDIESGSTWQSACRQRKRRDQTQARYLEG